ncbi:membrane-spanning 4-domains subfamily A member 12-like [Silurus meridionalis]|nr:membrane-spanning 4-domains subfamily A member 12-like [Silurus meridionalis]
MPLTAPKVDIKSLGIVQTMVGFVILMFGVAIKDYNLKTVNSGIMYWGSLCFIICGSLSVSVMEHRLPNLVKASLVMNVISAVAAFGAFIVFCIDLVPLSGNQPACQDIDKCFLVVIVYLMRGLLRVFIVFSVLEICMAIWTFILIWKSRDSIETIS